jgi:hypothetical protein
MKTFFGGLLFAVGILIAGASGLCSLTILGMGMSESGGLVMMFPLVAVFGGIPFALGLGLFFGGRALLRQAKRESMKGVAEVFDQDER